MFIQTETTPNPQTIKFMPGIEVIKTGYIEIKSEEDAVNSPLASSLFKINGVARVFFGNDFISVTKDTDQDWELLKTHIMAVIMEHFSSGLPVLNEELASHKSSDEDLDETSKQIKDLIEERVQPAVANDGGYIEFVEFNNDTGVVYLELRGACAGCPSSTLTLKAGIENMLKHFVPEVCSVEQVMSEYY
jgi:Fe-S cluster biogenesis protein NfuA